MKASKWFWSGFLLMILAVSCQRKADFPMEGTWQMVYGDWMSSDGSTFPVQIKGSQIKTWTQWNFTFVGQFAFDRVKEDTYGAGDYVLNGNHYVEKLIYHSTKSYVNQEVFMIVEFKGDTLIQRWPADKDWNLPERHCTEKYIRLYH